MSSYRAHVLEQALTCLAVGTIAVALGAVGYYTARWFA